MSRIAVVGAQWGDEGKGKIVDLLSAKADIVVRFQGGNNAGHTLVIDGETFVLSLLPSGVVRPDKISLIGPGVVVDPFAFLQECAELERRGLDCSPGRLKLASNAHLVLPLHAECDRLREEALLGHKIGTTKKGIGPAYEDKVGRRGLRLCDLGWPETLRSKVDRLLLHHNALRQGMGAPLLEASALHASLLDIAPRLLPFAADIGQELDKHTRSGKKILFEGAQGAMLDVDHGTYPYVTSSTTLAGQLFSGAAFPVGKSCKVLGLAKAYATRVGGGPFPSECSGEVGRLLGERGSEFGAVTGRRRRCGWFDAVLARRCVALNGAHSLIFSKLDVLDSFSDIHICTGYSLDGRAIDYFPCASEDQDRLKPLYERMDGWQCTTRGVRDLAALPKAARAYIARIESLLDCPMALISTSPEREDVIMLEDVWA